MTKESGGVVLKQNYGLFYIRGVFMNKILKRSVIALMVLGVSTFSGMYNNVYAKGQNAVQGENATAEGDWSTAYGPHAIAKGTKSTAIGYKATAERSGATALGDNSKALGAFSIACGANATASEYSSIACGFNAKASGNFSIAYGDRATASGYESIAHGVRAIAKGDWSTAYGSHATAEGLGSIAYGPSATAQGKRSTAIGQMAKAESDWSVAIGDNSTAKGLQSVAMGKGTKSEGKYSVAIGDSSVTKDDYEFSVGRDAIDENNGAVYRRVTHVAYGINAEDAVNVAQLQKVENNFNKMINEIDARVDESSAGAAALSALHPLTNEFDPSNKFDFAVGYGNYRNKSAMALGAYYRPNANVLMSIGGTFGNGDSMVNAGMSFKIGKISKSVKHESETEKEIALLKEQNEKLVKAMQEQNEKFEKAMQEQNEKLVKLEMILQKLETK